MEAWPENYLPALLAEGTSTSNTGPMRIQQQAWASTLNGSNYWCPLLTSSLMERSLQSSLPSHCSHEINSVWSNYEVISQPLRCRAPVQPPARPPGWAHIPAHCPRGLSRTGSINVSFMNSPCVLIWLGISISLYCFIFQKEGEI